MTGTRDFASVAVKAISGAATALLLAGAAQAGPGKALGGAVGGVGDLGTAIGRSLDDVNLGGVIDNAVPSTGAVPNIGTAVPNLGNGGAVPNLGGQSAGRVYDSVPPLQGNGYGLGPPPAGAYDSVPPVQGGVYDSVPPLQGGVYDSVPPLQGGVYDSVPPLQGGTYGAGPPSAGGGYGVGPAVRQTGDVYDLAPTGPLPGSNVGTYGPGPNITGGNFTGIDTGSLARQLPDVPAGRNLSGVSTETLARQLPDPPANPGFYKRNRKTILGAGGGIVLGGAGAGAYYAAEDIAEGQRGGDSALTDAYDATAEWSEGAVETVSDWFE